MQVNFVVPEVYREIGVYYPLLARIWDVAQRALEERPNRGHEGDPGARSGPATVEG
jgi:hypothetical protein